MKTLEEIELFNEYTISNVPSFLFFISLIICVLVVFMAGYLGLFFSFLFLAGLFYFHKDDPHAFIILIKSFSLSDKIEHGKDKPIKFRKV